MQFLLCASFVFFGDLIPNFCVMASSSKDCENGTRKKVVVVKANDFFSLRQVNLRDKKERLEELKMSLTPSNASFLSNICDLSTPSTSESTTYTPKYKHLSSSSNRNQSTPKRVYRRKVSIAGDGSGKTKLVDFAELSKAVNTDNTIVAKKNETLNVSDDLSEEKIMELIDRKYGAAIEAQLSVSHATTVQDNPKPHRGGSDSVAELPCNVHEYKLREERFLDRLCKEQSVNDEVKEVERHLESILILDSPEDGYKLFTREELKRLPVKIFESPDKLIIKREFLFSKEEKFEPQNSNVDLQDLKSSVEGGDIKIDTVSSEAKVDNMAMKEVKENFGDEQPQRSNVDLRNLKSSAENCAIKTDACKTESKVENVATKEVDGEKKMWEFNSNDINFDILMSQTDSRIISKPGKENEKCGKAVAIANEDAVIFKEMDEFIEEINIGKQILSSNETPVAVNEIKEDCDHSYCLQNAGIGEKMEICQRGGADEEKPQEKMTQTSDSQSSNICVDAAKFEDIVKYMIQQNDLLDQIKAEETADASMLETTKSDILEKLVREAEIYIDPSPNIGASDGIAIQNESKYDDNSSANDQTQRSVQKIPSSSSFDERRVESQTKRDNSNKDFLNKDGRDTGNDKIDRDEILMLLEKTKARSSDKFESDDNSEKENLKHLSCSLKKRLTILKELYGQLEKTIESTVKRLDQNLTAEEVCRLHDNLSFVKGIIEKASAKDERKKLKYKVISIRRKSTDLTRKHPAVNKSLTKKVYNDVTPPKRTENISNKLLRKTLLRMNKLLDVLEKKGTSAKTTQSNSVLKPAKSNVKPKSGIDKSSSGAGTLKLAKSCEELGLNKSLTVVLEKSRNRDKIDTRIGTKKSISVRGERLVPLPVENVGETAKAAPSVNRPTAAIKVDTKRERQQTCTGNGKESPNGKNGAIQEDHPVRYALRSRKITAATVESPERPSNSSMISSNKTGSQKSDRVLKNNNQPCVVSYDKEAVSEKSVPNSKNKDLVDLAEGDRPVEAIRYELRRSLRIRRI